VVIFVDKAIVLSFVLAVFGVAGATIATLFYFYKWPKRWTFPALGYIGALLQAAAWLAVLVGHSIGWWNFLTTTGFVCLVIAALGALFAVKHRQFTSQRIADVLFMLGGLCQIVAVATWLSAHFFA